MEDDQDSNLPVIEEWQHEYVSEIKSKRIVTPQVRALHDRLRRGLGPATPAITAQRVAVIADLMRRDCWTRKRRDDLMRKWDLSRARVNQLAAEASRWTAAEATDIPAVAETVATVLMRKLEAADELAQIAVQRVKQSAKTATPAANQSLMKDASMMFTAIDKIADTFTKVVGARAPDKNDDSLIIAQFDNLTPEQKVVFLEERIERLTFMRDQIMNSPRWDNSKVRPKRLAALMSNKEIVVEAEGAQNGRYSSENGPGVVEPTEGNES